MLRLIIVLLQHSGTFRYSPPRRARVRRAITIYIGVAVVLFVGLAVTTGSAFAAIDAVVSALWFLKRTVLDAWTRRQIKRLLLSGDAASQNRAP